MDLETDRLPAAWLERIEIRLAIQADLPHLEWDGEYAHFRRVFEYAYQDAARGRALLWVAAMFPGGQLIGQVFVQLKSARDGRLADGLAQAYIYSVRVREDYRNAGLGGRLMDMAEGDLRARGFQRAVLNVARDNPGAYRFYQRQGYTLVGPDPGQWAYVDHHGITQNVDEPAWRLEKRL